MSDSRLEKFIYAICSMEVSDLPAPLSRIEKLWNCLITGETPDFEPLSRNEKYLMAMLDRYDISNLPAPMSRGEKLLYKIAVGETDLSDVPGYLSRYEELLKYLIENGGISEDDFEYVLYTLNQSLHTLYSTAEKPVKSAILKGQTLVNISPFTSKIVFTSSTISEHKKLPQPLKQNTKYILIFNINNSSSSLTSDYVMVRGYNTDGAFKEYGRTVKNFGNGKHCVLLESVDGDVERIFITSNFSCEIDDTILAIYQDGMENWDIPYFEGMQSVKMPVLKATGKNLCDNSKNKNIEIDYTTGAETVNYNVVVSDYIEINPLKSYVVSKVSPLVLGSHTFRYYNDKKEYIGTSKTNEAKYVKIRQTNQNSKLNLNDILFQFEEGSTATTYEPFKSNILSVNENVVLRGIGEVQDTLDCLTGEMTERIGEVVLDGSQPMDADSFGVYIQMDDVKRLADYTNIITCDKLPTIPTYRDLPKVTNGISGYSRVENYLGQNWLYLKINNSVDKNEIAQWLSENPITVQYHLETESIKTVDLTVVNQDNQPTQLGTFENVTHVSLEAENLIPEVEMEVATRISKELASASPLMDDISTKQEQLNTTIDEQSNNVDATMIATTEIYEETL